MTAASASCWSIWSGQRVSRAEPLLPWAPRPFKDEAFGGWLGRLAAAYAMSVEEFADYAGLSAELDCGRVNWLGLPKPGPGDCERLARLCRLPSSELPAAYEADAPACLAYCHRCLYLNPADVTAPYWQASWLAAAGGQHCGVHGRRYEQTCLSVLRGQRNMKRLLHVISRTRAARARAAARQQWVLAGFVTR